MHQESSQYLNSLSHQLGHVASIRFVLFGFRKNRTLYSARSSLIHSYGYESADDRTDYLARFPLNSEPLMNYPGNPTASRRRTMHQKYTQYLNSLSRLLSDLASVRFVLFEFRGGPGAMWVVPSLRYPWRTPQPSSTAVPRPPIKQRHPKCRTTPRSAPSRVPRRRL